MTERSAVCGAALAQANPTESNDVDELRVMKRECGVAFAEGNVELRIGVHDPMGHRWCRSGSRHKAGMTIEAEWRLTTPLRSLFKAAE